MRSFFTDLGLFNYMLLLIALTTVIINVDIYNNGINTDPTIEEIQAQYIKDLDKAVEDKQQELRAKGLLLKEVI